MFNTTTNFYKPAEQVHGLGRYYFRLILLYKSTFRPKIGQFLITIRCSYIRLLRNKRIILDVYKVEPLQLKLLFSHPSWVFDCISFPLDQIFEILLVPFPFGHSSAQNFIDLHWLDYRHLLSPLLFLLLNLL